MMNDNTINSDVTMVEPAPSKGTGRFRSGDEILGRYVVESELGQGGMGVVYLCLDKVGGVKVAVKGLPPEVSHNADEMEAVRDNFRLVSELQHPNIAGARHLEKDEATGDYFLVMTYARGVSLKRWMRSHGGREHRAEQLKVLRQIASALDYAHNAEPRNIIHRDIKPDNVMVDELGNAMVLDFGLAAQVRSSMSRVSQVVTSRSGTPSYKSPEQWLAQVQRAPSDQYSLGVIAYQMFAGTLPFDSDDIEILKHAVAFDPMPVIPGEDRSVNEALAKVLAKRPQDRFASCTAFVDALEGRRPSAEDGGLTNAMMALIAGVLIVFVGLCGWWVWKIQADSKAERKALTEQRLERMRKQKMADDARIAAEKARRMDEAKRKAEDAQRAEAKAEAERQARKAEAERKAKAEAEERAIAEARETRRQEQVSTSKDEEQLRMEATQEALKLFRSGKWLTGYREAQKADQENPELLYYLGKCYTGENRAANQDQDKASDYFRQAAEKGWMDAQYELGRRYESGNGVKRDCEQAKRWYRAASRQGSKDAQNNLDRLVAEQSAALSEVLLVQSYEEPANAEMTARESDNFRKIQDEVATLRNTVKQEQEKVERISDRTSQRFTKGDAETLSQLKFDSQSARSYYLKACKVATEKGATQSGEVRRHYERGLERGGPKWPELEAWLDWWK